MLSLEDPKWRSLDGGYRRPYDASAALRRLQRGEEQGLIWFELWNELHHQGDVGEASYAAVPILVSVQDARRDLDWNFYALIATIEIERYRHHNPPIPDWLRDDYKSAWKDLQTVALRDYELPHDPVTARAILGVLALCKGLRIIGAAVSHFDESEIAEFFGGLIGDDPAALK
jgi:hypothetical protein